MIDSQAILQQVRANQALLAACKRHTFQPEGDQRQPLGMKYRCTACQGKVDASAKLWYERGLQHAEAGQAGGVAGTLGERA